MIFYSLSIGIFVAFTCQKYNILQKVIVTVKSIHLPQRMRFMKSHCLRQRSTHFGSQLFEIFGLYVALERCKLNKSNCG